MIRRPALALLSLLLLAASAGAQEAKLLAVHGRVLLRHGGRQSEAAAGRALSFGDEVRTLKGSLAQVSFPDGATVLVKENTSFVLVGTIRRTTLSFSIGEFLIGLKHKLGPRETFRVRTPSSVAAVRGTLFWGLSEANQDSTFAALENELVVTAQGKSVTLKPGKKTKVVAGQPPAPPESANVPSSFLNTFAVDGSIQGLDGLLK
jgi:hypothetical protein